MGNDGKKEYSDGVINLVDKQKQPIAGTPSFSEMVQLIMQNDNVYSFLIYYFLDWISDSIFEEDAEEEVKKGKTLRQVHAEYFAAWIPWEDCADKLIERIHELTKDG